MMGAPDEHIVPARLDDETARIASFIDRTDQYNWMIELDGTIVGAIWVDLQPSATLAAPASLAAVTDFASGEGSRPCRPGPWLRTTRAHRFCSGQAPQNPVPGCPDAGPSTARSSRWEHRPPNDSVNPVLRSAPAAGQIQ
jgi:hypothetical protein